MGARNRMRVKLASVDTLNRVNDFVKITYPELMAELERRKRQSFSRRPAPERDFED